MFGGKNRRESVMIGSRPATSKKISLRNSKTENCRTKRAYRLWSKPARDGSPNIIRRGPKGGLKSLHGRKCEASYLRQLVKRLGNRKLKSITLDNLKDYQSSRQSGIDGSRPVQGRPINCELAILVSVLKEANLWFGALKNYSRLPEGEERVGNALTSTQKKLLEETAASREEWKVAYLAFMLAVNTGMRGAEIKKLRLRHVDLEIRRLAIEDAKTEAGNRIVELNQSAFSAVTKLWVRAQQLGASELNHYLLPADLSRHTKTTDPLKSEHGFDVERHQESWSTAWRNLRAAAAAAVEQRAKKKTGNLRLPNARTWRY